MTDVYFNELKDTLDHINREEISNVASLIKLTKGNIFVFGNGGSSSTASHFAQDMNKCLDYRFICLNDNVPSITAYANDVDYASVFKLQLSKLVNSGDLVIGISCSGNSPNVISAISYAKHYGYMTVGLTGLKGGELKNISDFNIHVPSSDMQICEDCHMIIIHTLLKILK